MIHGVDGAFTFSIQPLRYKDRMADHAIPLAFWNDSGDRDEHMESI